MKNQNAKQYQLNAFSKFFGVIFIIIGIFFTVMLFGFHPEDSLYFTTRPADQINHFLGKIGASISAFLFYFMGRASYLFTFFLVYSGYILLRKLSSIKKSGYIILSLCTFILSLGVFSRPENDMLHKSGGLFGKFILDRLVQYIKKDVVFILFLTLFTVVIAFLLKYPVKVISNLISRFISRIKDSNTGISTKPEKNEDEYSFDVQDFQYEDEQYAVDKRKMRIKRKKPPLIRKVFYEDEGNIIKPDTGVCKAGKKIIPPDPNLENGKGQYLLSETAGAGNISSSADSRKIVMPDSSLLKKSRYINRKERDKETIRKARELERTLNEFGIDAKVTGIIRGPVITRYELQPAPGVKLSRIVNLSDNIALNLSANGVRIEAPIPGKSAVGIEIPNEEREIVTLGDIITEAEPEGELPLILGKDISGKVIVSDLAMMPHLLIAGATGSGKSVCVNSLIVSLLFHKRPEELRFIMIDPKMVELKIYNGIPHLLIEVITNPRDVLKSLRWVTYEMENRYRLLDENFVRDITGYNRKVKERLPYIIIIIDEFANLMAISQKEVEDTVVRLAAMSRAVGIHLILSTQRPSVDVITGLIKANFPYRIAFQVASKIDSRTILDTIGAEKLLGRGDMLFSPAGSMNIRRIQGAYILEEEVLSIVHDLKTNYSPDYIEDILSFDSGDRFDMADNDPMFDEAVEIILKTKRASASFLQRRLKIGYNRAARLIELMEEKGIIGPPRGSKPREIYIDRID